MAFRSAAFLGLALRLVLAEPGHLRGLSANSTGEAPAGGLEASLAGVPNSTGSELMDIALPGVAEGAQNASQVAGNLTSLAATAGSWYWDGECHPFPCYLYQHCSAGGVLIGQRRCGTAGAYCEGRCSRPAAPAPAPPAWAPAPAPAPGHTGGNIMTLYHKTSPAIADAIMAGGFRPGHSGWCGGAIYFFTSPNVPQSKLGPDSHSGAVIEAKVSMGRMAHLDSKCHGANDARQHYDSITFNPGDGSEYIVFSNDHVISKRRYY